MIADIDEEMHRRGLEGILALGETTMADPDLTYLAGTFLARGGIYVRRRDQPDTVVVSNIDVGSAKKGRVKTIETYTDYDHEKLVAEHGRNRAFVLLIQRILEAKGIAGKIALYGRGDLARGIRLSDNLRAAGIDAVGESSPTLLEALRETKSKDELRRIEDVAARCQLIVRSVTRLLSHGKVRSGKLRIKGKTVTVADVKRLIGHGLADHGLRAPEGTIFAVGASSADPHNMGVPSQPIRPSQPIIFDIFPQTDSGYWYDLTRTYVIGRIPSQIKRMHEAVVEAQLNALDEIREAKATKEVAELSCEVVEKHGFLSMRSLLKGDLRARTTGFNHGLGHGVGLTIGERPYLTVLSDERLAKGHVVTVEPGIYEPRRGGVRIEDTVFVTNGKVKNPATLHKDLEI